MKVCTQRCISLTTNQDRFKTRFDSVLAASCCAKIFASVDPLSQNDSETENSATSWYICSWYRVRRLTCDFKTSIFWRAALCFKVRSTIKHVKLRRHILCKWCALWCNNDLRKGASLSSLAKLQWQDQHMIQRSVFVVHSCFYIEAPRKREPWGIQVCHAQLTFCGSGKGCPPSTEASMIYSFDLCQVALMQFSCRNTAADDANCSSSHGLLLHLWVCIDCSEYFWNQVIDSLSTCRLTSLSYALRMFLDLRNRAEPSRAARRSWDNF